MKKLAAVVLALGLLAACSDDGSSDGADQPTTTAAAASTEDATTTAPSEAEELTGSVEEFYAVPDPLPDGKHGDLIRYQQLKADDDATTYRIMYLSESVAGDPIAVTGSAVVPEGAAPEGGRRLFTIAHGTTGIADECTPSKEATGAEMALSGPLSEQGILMAESDYEGLGTPGRHPYLVGESEGRGVIDAILAAKQLPDAEGGDQLAIAGYSQGGHGALWANEVAEEWAPDLDVVGTFAGAPATELDIILSAMASSPLAGGFGMMIVAGFNAAYGDQADPAAILTDKGVAALPQVDEGCVAKVIGGFAGQPGLVKQQALPKAWVDLGRENNPGNVVTEAPILIVHSKQDDVVPVGLSQALFGRMCQNGQVVDRRVLDKGQGHGAAAPDAFAQGLVWLQDRFDGKEAESACPAGSGQAATTTTAPSAG